MSRFCLTAPCLGLVLLSSSSAMGQPAFSLPLQRLATTPPGQPPLNGIFAGPATASVSIGDPAGTGQSAVASNTTGVDTDEMLANCPVNATVQAFGLIGDCRSTAQASCLTAIGATDWVAQVDTTVTGQATISPESSLAETSSGWANIANADTIFDTLNRPGYPAVTIADLHGFIRIMAQGQDPQGIGLSAGTLFARLGRSNVTATFNGPGAGWLINGVLQQDSIFFPLPPVTIGDDGMGGGGLITLTDSIDFTYEVYNVVGVGPGVDPQRLTALIWGPGDGRITGGAGAVVANYLWNFKVYAYYDVKTTQR